MLPWPLESTKTEFLWPSYDQNSEQVSGSIQLEFFHHLSFVSSCNLPLSSLVIVFQWTLVQIMDIFGVLSPFCYSVSWNTKHTDKRITVYFSLNLYRYLVCLWEIKYVYLECYQIPPYLAIACPQAIKATKYFKITLQIKSMGVWFLFMKIFMQWL